jgi:Fe-S-cluster-containing hydrogenase component 2
MKGWVEIFKAGRQVDSAGNARDWTEQDLDKIVEQYGSGNHEAPIVVGHPEHNSPSFGWVESLKRDGKLLLAKFKDVMPEFADLVKAGTYKKRSISLYPDLTLRHIGFLGGMPPAVKGLADIAFADDGKKPMVIEFGAGYGESPLRRAYGVLRNLFSEMSGMQGGEIADAKSRSGFCADCGDNCCLAACPSGAISMTADKGAVIDPAKCTVCMACCQACCMMNDPVAGMQVANYQDKETSMKDEEVQQLVTKSVTLAVQQFSETTSKTIALLETKLAQLEGGMVSDRESVQRREFREFLMTPEMQRRVPEAGREATVNQMVTLSVAAPVQFGEGDAKTARPALEVYKEQLRALPEVVQFGEHATREKVGDLEQVGGMSIDLLAAKAREFRDAESAAGRTVTYTDAVAHVKKKGGGN